MLAADTLTSFAMLVYQHPEEIVAITADNGELGIVGFNAGDMRRITTILDSERRGYPLENFNVFRVDGRQ